MTLDALEFGILAPAFLAGLLVLATHVPLGRRVLARGIIFIDLAIAQIAGLGVIGAGLLGWGEQGWAVQLAAALAALAGAALLYVTERRWPEIQEAVIGVVFVLAASLGLLLLGASSHGGEMLKDLLAGQVLWVSYAQLGPVAALTLAVLALWYWRGAGGSALWFYPLFAVAVTASVQLVGVYLVFASLIVPALAVRGLGERAGLVTGLLLGACAYAIGLAASALFDLPAGPLIVWVLVVVALLTAALRCWLSRWAVCSTAR